MREWLTHLRIYLQLRCCLDKRLWIVIIEWDSYVLRNNGVYTLRNIVWINSLYCLSLIINEWTLKFFFLYNLYSRWYLNLDFALYFIKNCSNQRCLRNLNWSLVGLIDNSDLSSLRYSNCFIYNISNNLLSWGLRDLIRNMLNLINKLNRRCLINHDLSIHRCSDYLSLRR